MSRVETARAAPTGETDAAPASVLSRPRVVVSAAVVAGIAGVAVIGTGDVVIHPDAFAALLTWNIAIFVAGGLYWRRLQPENRFGGMLLLMAFVSALQALQGSPHPGVFAVGVLTDVPLILLWWYLLLSFPSGRLSRFEHVVFGLGVVYIAGVYLPWTLLADTISGGAPLARCGAACPANPLQIGSFPGLADALHTAMLALRLVVAVALATTMAVRSARARRPQRALLSPVAALGILWALLFGAYGFAVATLGQSDYAAESIGIGLTLARALVPLAFLLAPLHARAFAGAALQRMIRRFESVPTLVARERVIAETLDDPSLRVAFWLPRSRRWVTPTGGTFEPPVDDPRTAWTHVDRVNAPVAGIAHDRALSDSPELVDAAARALLLALGGLRVEEDLERDLRESRRRLIAADAAQRHRLERELHRTAQQHLVAIRIGLELARARAEENEAIAGRLAKLERQIDETLDEVRRITVGLTTPSLERLGLKAGLVDMARRLPQQPKLDLQDVGRLPSEVESCLYSCIVEAVTEALGHAGAGDVSVRLARTDDAVEFAVRCAGPGIEADPAVLAEIGDRAEALDGSATVSTIPGGGIVVSGTVPVANWYAETGKESAG